MARETQLDTHEIDKLLADDDFIDDFNFDEEEDIDFVIDEPEPEPEAEPEPPGKGPSPEPEPEIQSPETDFATKSSSSQGSAAGLVVSENIMADVADEFEGFDLTGMIGRVRRPRGVKPLALVFLLLFLLQLLLVVVLVRRPVRISSPVQGLTEEIDLTAATRPPVASEGREIAEMPLPDEPQVLRFELFVPLYSLKGLKVVSLEIEVVQFPPFTPLSPLEEEHLRVILGHRLRALTAVEMLEKIKDLPTFLEPPLKAEIEGFFAAREKAPAKLEIQFPATHVQE